LRSSSSSPDRSIRAGIRRRTMKISVATLTVLATLAVAAPASAWPMCGW
jgi:hypothetical protein